MALDLLYSYPEDSGTYMCKATNLVGEAVTTCNVGVEGEYAARRVSRSRAGPAQLTRCVFCVWERAYVRGADVGDSQTVLF